LLRITKQGAEIASLGRVGASTVRKPQVIRFCGEDEKGQKSPVAHSGIRTISLVRHNAGIRTRDGMRRQLVRDLAIATNRT